LIDISKCVTSNKQFSPSFHALVLEQSLIANVALVARDDKHNHSSFNNQFVYNINIKQELIWTNKKFSLLWILIKVPSAHNTLCHKIYIPVIYMLQLLQIGNLFKCRKRSRKKKNVTFCKTLWLFVYLSTYSCNLVTLDVAAPKLQLIVLISICDKHVADLVLFSSSIKSFLNIDNDIGWITTINQIIFRFNKEKIIWKNECYLCHALFVNVIINGPQAFGEII